MVAAEAASAGALPVSAHHSGAAEVSRVLADALPGSVGGLVSFDLSPGAVDAIAARVSGWLSLPDAERVAAGEALRETAELHWSWAGSPARCSRRPPAGSTACRSPPTLETVGKLAPMAAEQHREVQVVAAGEAGRAGAAELLALLDRVARP